MNLGLWLQRSSVTVADTQSGFRAYDRDAIETIAESGEIGDGMDASLELLFHAARRGYGVEEVPSQIDYDVEHASTLNPVTHGLTLVRRIVVETALSWLWRTSPGATTGVIALSASVLATLGMIRGLFSPLIVFVLVGISVVVGRAVSSWARSALEPIEA
jgi:hypothetical protein